MKEGYCGLCFKDRIKRSWEINAKKHGNLINITTFVLPDEQSILYLKREYMTPIEFAPYSNNHLRFKLLNGEEMSGVLLLPVDESVGTNMVDFIPTSEMINYSHANQNRNMEKMNRIARKIDISNIVWAMRLKY